MTRIELEQYGGLQREIPMLEKRIDKLRGKEIEIVSGKVKASMKEFPYTEYRPTVLMEDPKAACERDKQIGLYQSRLTEARALLYRIESFIDTIGDSRTRLIFQFRYIDGHNINEAAKEFNYTKGRISQIIGEYVED